MSEIVGLHHVQMNVPAERAEEARRFYGGVLGLEEMPRPYSLPAAGRQGVWYRCGEGEFHVFFAPSGDYRNDSTSRHPAFLVADLEALRGRLEGAGVAVEEAVPIPGRRRFFCRDPFGNRLEFLAFDGGERD
ncbi:MAG: VOC family protein [Chloroflexi bacterium]|nr:VOC family protein [Chloroflexota bacterium]